MPIRNKKIAVLGSTGKVGKYLTRELVRQGYSVKALIRDPQKMALADPSMEVIYGNALDYNSIFNLLTGCDAVISTLGPSRNEPDTCSIAVGHVIKAMKVLNLGRYIEVAGLGIDTPGDKKGLFTRTLAGIMKWFASAVIADRQKVYMMLKDSPIHWTIARCPMIKLTDSSMIVKTSLTDIPGYSIGSSDLARFIIDQLGSEEYVCMAPFISN